MYVGRTVPFRIIWMFGWPNALRTTLLASAVYLAHEFFGLKFLSIPFLPVATIGTAVAFYVGFKNNSSYDRLWEARRIWGGITNTSRAWGISVMALVGHREARRENPSEVDATIRLLIFRHIAWVNALRIQLRRYSPLNASRADSPQRRAAVEGSGADVDGAAEVERILAEFAPEILNANGRGAITLQMLHAQAELLTELKDRKWLDDYEHSDLMRHVMECINNQGAAERIKTFPFPRQYANFSLIFVRLFTYLLPFSLMREMSSAGPATAWLVIPFSVLISWVFNAMEQIGDASENPFENSLNDVPMTAICRNIEVDLKEMLGVSETPARLQPVNGVLL